eukprot:5489812-Prymnesium_polylepis.1
MAAERASVRVRSGKTSLIMSQAMGPKPTCDRRHSCARGGAGMRVEAQVCACRRPSAVIMTPSAPRSAQPHDLSAPRPHAPHAPRPAACASARAW